jgi:hypothetical protein
VEAHSWLLFWADADVEQGVRHADFRLSNNGEYIGMFSPDGFTLTDEVEWGYIAPDTSYGRITDGSEQWVNFTGTTPDESNNNGIIHVAESELATLDVYPNPAQEYILFTERMNISVYNISGVLMEKHQNVGMLNCAKWATGIYIAQNDKGQVARIVKN